MKQHFINNSLTLFLFVLVFSSVDKAYSQAHVHGMGEAFIVEENNQWQIEFKVPSIDMLGFESIATSPEQVAKVKSVKEKLSKVENVVRLPDFCAFKSIEDNLSYLMTVKSSGQQHSHSEHQTHNHSELNGHKAAHSEKHKNSHSDNHEHSDEHHNSHDHRNGHDHSHNHSHDHSNNKPENELDKHQHQHSHTHDKHNKHKHADNEDMHSDVSITIMALCEQKVENFEVTLFEMAQSLESLSTQWLANGKQGFVKLSPKNSIVEF